MQTIIIKPLRQTQLITALFGIFIRCDSMTEICEGLRAMGGKLNYLGLEKAPAKSTASDGSCKLKANNPTIPLSLKGVAIPS